jgi:hypothetical protein
MVLRKFLSTFWVAIALSSCSTTGSKPPLDPAALRSPKEGQGLVYVMRKGALIGVATPATVIFDGKEMGTPWNNRYLALPLAPGKHTVNIKWIYLIDQVNIDAEQDHVYFIETSWKNSGGCGSSSGICYGTGAALISRDRALSLLSNMEEVNSP